MDEINTVTTSLPDTTTVKDGALNSPTQPRLDGVDDNNMGRVRSKSRLASIVISLYVCPCSTSTTNSCSLDSSTIVANLLLPSWCYLLRHLIAL